MGTVTSHIQMRNEEPAGGGYTKTKGFLLFIGLIFIVSIRVSDNKEDCQSKPTNLLGPLVVKEDVNGIEMLEKYSRHIHPGGRYDPTSCKQKIKIAIIIPFRDRE